MAGLEGKLALVTGASRGYGRAIARRLARDGATVAVHYGSDDDAARSTVTLIEGDGGSAFVVKAPLDGSVAGVDVLFAGIEKGAAEHGRSSAVDIVVNNAAVCLRGTIEETTEAIFDESINLNAKAPFFIIKKALERMPDGGRIVNISSQTSLIPFPGIAAYTMTKGAIDRLTLALARHLAPRNITINALLPGIADTDMNADWLRGKPDAEASASVFSVFKRIADVTDIADIVGFLVSHDARWITGQLIDGGGGSGL